MCLREIVMDDYDELYDMYNEIINNDKSHTFEGISNFKEIDFSDFSKFVDGLIYNKTRKLYDPETVNQTTYVLVDDNNHIYGAVNIRHELNVRLMVLGGNIGYLIRPNERRKGYGTLLLKLALKKCELLGMDKALVTCREENVASAGVIENNNGLYEDSRLCEKNGNIYRRYWVKVK